jgi:hypothetical protein
MTIDLSNLIEALDENPRAAQVPADTAARCESPSCGWKGTVGDCKTMREQDGPEDPEYETPVCPKCGDYVWF